MKLTSLILSATLLASFALGQIPGGVPVTGTVTPTDPADTYPITDTRWAKGGHLTWFPTEGSWTNTDTFPLARREAGMWVSATNAWTKIYRIEPDLVTFTPLTFFSPTNSTVSALTLKDGTVLTNGLSADRIQSTVFHRPGTTGAGKVAFWNSTNGLVELDITGDQLTYAITNQPNVTADIAKRALVSSSTILFSLGDSITFGSTPTAPVSVNSWNPIVANSVGVPLTNLAYSSSCIQDLNWQVMPGFLYTNSSFHGGAPIQSPTTISTNHSFLALVGYNDARDGFATDPAYMRFYNAALMHLVAWAGIPTSAKTYAQAAAVTGTWGNYAQHGGAIGRTATANASTITFTNLIGRSVYIGYLVTSASDLGTFSVTVDGVSIGTFDCNTGFANRTVRNGTAGPIPPQVGPNGDSTIRQSPVLARINGLTDTAHTVVITVATQPVTVLWAAGSGNARASLGFTSGPNVWIGGTLRCNPNGSLAQPDSSMAVFTDAARQVCAALSGDGIRVQHVTCGEDFDPVNMAGDFVHPNSAGHLQIANSFLRAMGSLRAPNLARSLSEPNGSLRLNRINAGLPVTGQSFIEAADNGTNVFRVGANGAVQVTAFSGSDAYEWFLNPAAAAADKLTLKKNGVLLFRAGDTEVRIGQNATTNSAVQFQHSSALDRRMLIGGNSIVCMLNSASTAQNMQIGSAGVNVAFQGTISAGGGNLSLPTGSVTWDPPSVAAGASTTTTVTVTGAVAGNPAAASLSTLTTQGLVISAFGSAADTATVVLYNPTGGAVDLASGTLKVVALKF